MEVIPHKNRQFMPRALLVKPSGVPPEPLYSITSCLRRRISSGMLSIRYGMRGPSPRRRPGRLFLGSLPLLPCFPADMLRLNCLQRSRKVF